MGFGDAIGGVISSGIGAIVTSVQNKKQRKWEEEQAWKAREFNQSMFDQQKQYNDETWNKQNAYNEKMWQMQNDYDSPASQMARFRGAGLNPALMYGQMGGGSAPLSAASYDTAEAPSAERAHFKPDPIKFDPVQGILAVQDLRARAAQTNNLEVQNQILQEQVNLTKAKTLATLLGNERGRFLLDRDSATRNIFIDTARTNLDRLRQDIEYRPQEFELKAEAAGRDQHRLANEDKKLTQEIILGNRNMSLKERLGEYQINESTSRILKMVKDLGYKEISEEKKNLLMQKEIDLKSQNLDWNGGREFRYLTDIIKGIMK